MPIPAGPSSTLPEWAPTREQVAAHVPRRTLLGDVNGFGTAVATFTDATTPTGEQCDAIILSACNWVLLVTGTLNAALSTTGADCAALRAAGLVELTWPDNREDLTDGELLLKLAESMRKDLAAANITLTGDDPTTDADDVLPVFVFDAATSYDWI